MTEPTQWRMTCTGCGHETFSTVEPEGQMCCAVCWADIRQHVRMKVEPVLPIPVPLTVEGLPATDYGPGTFAKRQHPPATRAPERMWTDEDYANLFKVSRERLATITVLRDQVKAITERFAGACGKISALESDHVTACERIVELETTLTAASVSYNELAQRHAALKASCDAFLEAVDG